MFNQHELIKDEVDLYYAYGLRNPFYIFVHYFKLAQICKNYKLVHAQYGSAVGFLVGLLNCKKVLTLRGSDWYKTKSPKFKDQIRIFIGYYFTRISLKFFYKNVIVVSERFKSEILNNYPNLNLSVFTTPINLTKFYPIKNNDSVTQKNILFATIKLDNPVKRVELAQESFELLKKKMPNVNWYVMNNVHHNEVNEFINKADVILLTSTHEGWPNVIKECLACNVPFVSTDVSDLKQIANQTTNCFVVDEANASDIAIALEKSLKEGKNQNLSKFVEPFNSKFSQKILFDIYQGLK